MDLSLERFTHLGCVNEKSNDSIAKFEVSFIGRLIKIYSPFLMKI